MGNKKYTRSISLECKIKKFFTSFEKAPWCPALMALDSKAAFQQRAAQIEIPVQEVDALELAGIDTYAKYAFCSQYQPGAQDEKPLVEFLEQAIGHAPNGEMMSKYRRLFFESHALCLQDLRQKVERTDHTETKVLPLAEKVERVNQVKARLPGLLITQQLEPSHQLVDKAVQQWEENSLRYIELTACTSREQKSLPKRVHRAFPLMLQGTSRSPRSKSWPNVPLQET